MSRYHLCVMGNGAIGSLFSAMAQQAGFRVTRALKESSTAVSSVRLHNQQVIHLDSDIIHPSTESNLQPDLIVLPLKVYQLRSAITQWQSLFSRNTPVLLLQNGMGGETITRAALPHSPLYLGTTSHGALKVSPREVHHTGLGQTLAGSALGALINDAPTPGVMHQLNSAFPPVTISSDIHLALWQKLAVNAVINPLTALHNIRNGGILTPQFSPLIKALCEETATVMRACGIDEAADLLFARVMTVAKATAANYSSMHQDVINARPTEIDAITGYLLSQAEAHQIDIPHHQQLYDRIKAITAN